MLALAPFICPSPFSLIFSCLVFLRSVNPGQARDTRGNWNVSIEISQSLNGQFMTIKESGRGLVPSVSLSRTHLSVQRVPVPVSLNNANLRSRPKKNNPKKIDSNTTTLDETRFQSHAPKFVRALRRCLQRPVGPYFQALPSASLPALSKSNPKSGFLSRQIFDQALRFPRVAQSGLVWERFREWGKYSGEIIINVTSDDTGCSIFTVQRDTHHASMNNPVTLLPVYDGKGAAKTWLRLRVLVEMAVAGINCAFQALVEMRDEGFRRSRELPSAPACTSVARLEGKLFTDHDSIASIHHCDEFVRSGEVGSRSSGIWMVKEIPAHYSKFLFSEEGLLAFIGNRRTSPVNRRIGDLSPDPCTSEW
ncbi:hypothetical protein EV359DRAFT_62813 [Lentinula novae-zelandiae]|nr:hypothetical protein EV359DRAFT_62813 [Lentinula novae-zelandiae]